MLPAASGHGAHRVGVRAGYVLLSETYRIWADAARSYGWPVDEVMGTHLELVNRPGPVTAAIERVVVAAREPITGDGRP